jgi:Uma2 family endonuclease
MSTVTPDRPDVEYPDSDGMPMSDNTLQFRWIMTIQGGLDALFRDNPDVFVAGDLLWYPVEGNNTIRAAPDTMVVFGRPQGDRGSYRQWEEGGIAPQAVFEILSPGNRPGEMEQKFRFYERYGVEEYYLYDPDNPALQGWRRVGDRLEEIPDLSVWRSPRLGIRFDLSAGELRVLKPDGTPFATYRELDTQREQEKLAKEQERQAREQAELAREQERQAREQAELAREQAQRESQEFAARSERLAAKLRELGVDPDA